jgi:hypothetical protein
MPARVWFGSGGGDDGKPRFDRSWDGMVFFAEEVADTAVCARVVYAPEYKAKYIGTCESLNLREIEVMRVTKRYADLLKGD